MRKPRRLIYPICQQPCRGLWRKINAEGASERREKRKRKRRTKGCRLGCFQAISIVCQGEKSRIARTRIFESASSNSRLIARHIIFWHFQTHASCECTLHLTNRQAPADLVHELLDGYLQDDTKLWSGRKAACQMASKRQTLGHPKPLSAGGRSAL